MYYTVVLILKLIEITKGQYEEESGTDIAKKDLLNNERDIYVLSEENIKAIKYSDNNCDSKNLREFNCEDPTTTTTTTEKTEKLTTKTIKRISRYGPFYNFLVNICKVLLNYFSKRRIPLYFEVLSDSIKNMGGGFLMKREIKKFRKLLRKLSLYNGKILKESVMDFLAIITSGRPKIDAFFDIMNSLYGVYEDNKFDDYIYVLKRYGKKLSSRIRYHTEEVFYKWITRIYDRQSETTQRDIKIKFGEALIEYKEAVT